MIPKRIRLRLAGLASLAVFMMLFCVAQAAYPPEADLSVAKSAPLEVDPGEAFQYVITVSNGAATAAPEVVVTDKLPYELQFVNITVDPALGVSAVNMSGDLIYVRFDEIPANTTGNIVINVIAPTETPTTLYNIVNLRYGNDPDSSDNRMTVPTYVQQVGYNQTLAAFSFEDLLHNQSQLLFEFEDLMHTIPQTADDKYNFSVSFEQLLRSQADLTSSFEDLLTNASSTGWDDENYTLENKTALLWSYEQMLYEEAFLFASFNVMINDSFADLCNFTADGHTQDAQTELIASFEDLLKRQNRLYKSFNLLLNDEPTLDNDVMVDFLAAYENLLRIEANLYMSFYNLLNMKYEGQGPCNETVPTPPGCVPPTINVTRIEMNPGQKFVINVTNNDVVSLNVATLTGTGGLVNSPGAIYSITDLNWTLAGNVGIYTNLPASIGPGATQTFVLDKLSISGTVNLPDDLVFTFCATTDCGQVCMTDTDNIRFLAPLPP